MFRLIDESLAKLQDTLRRMAEESIKSLDVVTSVEAKEASRRLLELSQKLKTMKERVDDISLEAIVRYQPTASDLRFIKSAMEISYDLYRISRYAYDIANALGDAGVSLRECIDEELNEILELVKSMVSDAVEALFERNEGKAWSIKKSDERVDKAYLKYFKKALEARDKCSLSNLLIMRYLERIADHCSYISDSVIFLVSGSR